MDKKQAMKRAAGWLLMIGALVVLVVLVPLAVTEWGAAEAEWGQVIVQALAALGGLWFWAYRSRPRVTLRVGMRDSIYLDLTNVGNRVARNVRVTCNPPIPMDTMMTNPPRPPFGPVENFGDMDRDQRFMMPVGSPGPGIIDLLEQATFEIAHESTWGFRPYRSEIRFRGAGLRRSIREDAVGQIATAVGGYGQKMDKIGQALDGVTRRLRPPAEGGDALDEKVCTACGWERFTYYGSGQYAEFWCANCDTKQNPECECGVTWCEHRPPPRQSVKKW